MSYVFVVVLLLLEQEESLKEEGIEPEVYFSEGNGEALLLFSDRHTRKDNIIIKFRF